MLPRRQLFGGAVMGGMVTALTTPVEAQQAAAQRGGDLDLSGVVRSLDRIRTELQNQYQFAELAPVREAQKTFLRANGKMPDLIEVGWDMWFAAYDWHVRWQQPLNIGRDPTGRYTLVLFQTLLILRPEMPGAYVGVPYDNK